MFDEQNISDSGQCSGNYCPALPGQLEKLERLFDPDDELQISDEECLSTANTIATVELEVMRSSTQPVSCPSFEPLQAVPKTIPLCIQLGANLTDPAEKACAEAVAGHLSSECDRVVAVDELDGLMLFLWSEHDIEGVPISDYLSESRPLQGLVVHPRDSLSQVGAELRGMLGRSFEFVAI
jgi:hypothetical protein